MAETGENIKAEGSNGRCARTAGIFTAALESQAKTAEVDNKTKEKASRSNLSRPALLLSCTSFNLDIRQMQRMIRPRQANRGFWMNAAVC